ncbi:MAG: hypothetical protein ABW321_20445, partial [Polyangiales bacterium]
MTQTLTNTTPAIEAPASRRQPHDEPPQPPRGRPDQPLTAAGKAAPRTTRRRARWLFPLAIVALV